MIPLEWLCLVAGCLLIWLALLGLDNKIGRRVKLTKLDKEPKKEDSQ